MGRMLLRRWRVVRGGEGRGAALASKERVAARLGMTREVLAEDVGDRG